MKPPNTCILCLIFLNNLSGNFLMYWWVVWGGWNVKVLFLENSNGALPFGKKSFYSLVFIKVWMWVKDRGNLDDYGERVKWKFCGFNWKIVWKFLMVNWLPLWEKVWTIFWWVICLLLPLQFLTKSLNVTQTKSDNKQSVKYTFKDKLKIIILDCDY